MFVSAQDCTDQHFTSYTTRHHPTTGTDGSRAPRRARRRRGRGRPVACQPVPGGRDLARAPLAPRPMLAARPRSRPHGTNVQKIGTWRSRRHSRPARSRGGASARAQSASTRAAATPSPVSGCAAVQPMCRPARSTNAAGNRRREVANGGGADAGAVCLRCTARAAAQAHRSAGATAERERETRWSNTCALSIDISMMFCSARQLRTAASKASARKVRGCARTRGCASAFHWCSGWCT